MPMVTDAAKDAALNHIRTNSEELWILSADAADYAAASTAKLGSKLAPTISAPADATPNGRKITISAITDGTVDAPGGDASHYGLVKTSAPTALLVVQALPATLTVSPDFDFLLGETDIRAPDVT